MNLEELFTTVEARVNAVEFYRKLGVNRIIIPDGYEVVDFRKVLEGDTFISDANRLMVAKSAGYGVRLIIKPKTQIKRRRIVLTETGEVREAKPREFYFHTDYKTICQSYVGSSGHYPIYRAEESVVEE